MTNANYDHDQERLERSIRVWLTEGRPPLADRDAQIRSVLESVSGTPRTRARFLERLFDRGDGARRRADADGDPPTTRRRNRRMLTAAGVTTALAILALSVSVFESEPATPVASGAATLVVAADGSGDFATIQAAVDAAADGDTISIRPGTYTEAVVVDKDITLAGDGPREAIVISAPEDGPEVSISERHDPFTEPYAVQLLDTSATLEHVTLSGERSLVHASGGSPTVTDLHLTGVGQPYEGGSLPFGNAIMVNAGSTASILDNLISDGGPIGVFDGSEPLIEGNQLIDGPHIWGGFGDGTVIRGNTISGPLDRGIGVFDPASLTIEDNVISAAGNNAIDLEGGAGTPTVRGNTISDSGNVGISVFSGQPVIAENTLIDNRIHVSFATDAGRIAGNTASGGAAGVVITDGAPEIVDNVVEGASGRGVAISAEAAPVFAGNRVCDNAQNLHVHEANETFELDPGNEICEDDVDA
mgnify:FL=1